MADEDGASPREQLMEACRRNNPDLLQDLLDSPALRGRAAATAQFLNVTTDALGAGPLHVAAQYGSYEVLDLLLDQEGVEIDIPERREGDTCLHKAVRHVNEAGRQGGGGNDDDGGLAVVEILLDAGCDPRIRNKAKLKPIDLAEPRNKALRTMLQKAEVALTMAGDTVEDEDEGANGSGSDSD